MIDPQRRRVLAGLGATCASAVLPTLFPSVARAATWPGHAVTFIVPFPAGGPVDTTARFTTQPLGQMWSVPTVVDNKSGAGGIVGAQFAAKAAPDGYNFFFASIHHAVLPSLRNNLTYDITTDFVPVGMAAVFPIVLVVNASVPVNTVSELIAYAKKNPGKLSFGSSGTGGGTHLAGELFNAMAGTRIQHVPYRGSAPAMQDLLGGQVQVMFADGPSAVPHLSGGKVRALGVGNPTRSSMLPNVPTIAESGLPGYEAYSWSGVMAPKGTPPDIVKRMNADMVKVLWDPATAKGMIAAGAEPKPGTPEQFGEFVRNEIVKWRDLIKTADIKLE
ncbi:tripartite tricarboxylate transporter substrate binding protein [Achromobacter sp. JUb104]|uniref:Bug family tripartite tricarboxylate transporter substrate binding protein n=1 Tax=Achromobacter sp. JUb104 TaxID=2940590 RepID=UPI002169A673|nr:tripartite tricarboxylate transporter substrate binding protein [Achromobacter sp. JUb104]MCS3509124.1 tripartite-type tricarboxylate transporter receptor subunit TctC [Achromobacter sp. JUb104]